MKKRAMIHNLIGMTLLASVALMAGCGGGGGGDGGVTVSSTIVTGTASKGIIYPGMVNLYGVDPATNSKGTAPLKTVNTKPDGTYVADIGAYSGALIVEVSGTYTDEATKKPVTIDPAAPLHAMVDVVDGTGNNNRPVAVTPLTELAYKKVGGDFTATKIASANNVVSELFKVRDIIAIQPVEPNGAVMGGSSTEQQSYTLALATLSRMAETNTSDGAATFSEIEAILDSFISDMAASSDSALSPTNMAAFATALDTVTSPTSELSGFSSAVANLSAVGAKTLKLTISVGNIPAGTQLGTLKVTLVLPSGVSMRTDNFGGVQDRMISAEGVIKTGTAYMVGNYQAGAKTLTIALISNVAFEAGDCMTVTLDVKSGTTVSVSDISITIDDAKDAGPTYGPVTGVTVALR